jgi:RNA polymerase sigma-32 factor
MGRMDKRRVSGESSHSPALLARYIRDLRRCKPMTREFETKIAKEYQRTADPALAKQLVEANLRLVIKIAAEYSRFHGNLADLVQEGNLGLLEAVSRYDPDRGVRLASYAGWWIRAFILKYILDTARIVRAGRSRAERRGFFHGQAPPVDVSLDDPLGGDDSSATLMDRMTDARDTRADDAFESAQLKSILHDELEQFGEALGERDAAVFRDRLIAEDPRPRKEIASQFALSRERIRQIEKRLLERFRHFIGPSLGLNPA